VQGQRRSQALLEVPPEKIDGPFGRAGCRQERDGQAIRRVQKVGMSRLGLRQEKARNRGVPQSLEQVTALNETTSSLIERTSEQLRVQGTEINQLAASSTVDIGKLQAAFDNVFAAMDALDTFHAQAADSMAQTVTALQGQITRAKPYLERTRRGEITR